MSQLVTTQCLLILEAAVASELGLVITTNNPTKARAAIYTARKDFANPRFAELQIRVSPNDSEHEIWLIRRDVVQGFSIGSNEVA